MTHVCPHCGKTYQRNGPAFKAHVAGCEAKNDSGILDGIDKSKGPKIHVIREKESAPIPAPPSPAPQQIAPTPPPLLDPAAPLPNPGERNETGKILFKGLYIGAVVTQHSLNGTLKGFDTIILDKRDEYARMLDELAEKRGMRMSLPVEARLALEISTDAFTAFRARINDPIPIDQWKRNESSQSVPSTPSVPSVPSASSTLTIADVDKLFD